MAESAAINPLTPKSRPNEYKFKSFASEGPELSVRSMGHPGAQSMVGMARSAPPVSEMGVGKGGKITQKIYPDPYGLEVWKTEPGTVFAVYLVDAATAQEITGEAVAEPAVQENYQGPYFGLEDEQLADAPGSDKFTGLKAATSGAFPGDTSNVKAAE